MAWETLRHNLAMAGSDQYELMICDQGTPNKDYLDAMALEFKPTYFRRNIWNEGVARSLNQMMIRRRSPHAMFMPNDITLDKNWLRVAIEYLDDVKSTGVLGWEDPCGLTAPRTTLTGESGKEWDVFCEKDFKLDGSLVAGATIFSETLIEEIGYLDEDLGMYGYEDQLYCFRAKIANLQNYYIPNIKATHLGINEFELSPTYKAQKESHLHNSVGYFKWKAQNLYKTGIYVPAPIKRPEYT